MENHMDMVDHMGLDNVMDMLAEIWAEHQETAGKEAYGNMEVDGGGV